MSGASGDGVGVTSWGWRQVGNKAGDRWHRIWRVRWNERPGQLAEVTGPADATDALMLAWKNPHRLPWRPEGSED